MRLFPLPLVMIRRYLRNCARHLAIVLPDRLICCVAPVATEIGTLPQCGSRGSQRVFRSGR